MDRFTDFIAKDKTFNIKQNQRGIRHPDRTKSNKNNNIKNVFYNYCSNCIGGRSIVSS